mgnify:CR=1 FL=1
MALGRKKISKVEENIDNIIKNIPEEELFGFADFDEKAAERVGEVVSTHVIPRPHVDVEKIIKSTK